MSVNTGLLDARGTAQILYTLTCRFRAVEFADYCSIAEEIVLRDTILLAGKVDKLPRHLQSVLKPLIDEGIFVPLRQSYSIPSLIDDIDFLDATQLAIAQGLTEATPQDATYEASRLLGAEAATGLVATPLLRQLQHYGIVRRPYLENTVWDLASQYRRVSEAAGALRQRHRYFPALPMISIPPIALVAIQRSRHYDQVLANVLQLRREFRPLRDSLREIEERLKAGEISPKEAVAVEAEWRTRWDGLSEKLNQPSRVQIARTSAPLLREGARFVTSLATKDYLGTIDTALNWLGPCLTGLGSMKMRPLHRPVANYLATTDQMMKSSVARIFEHDFMTLDGHMSAIAQHGSPWRKAIDSTPRASIPRLPDARSSREHWRQTNRPVVLRKTR